MTNSPDHEDALRLAAKIHAYWVERGYPEISTRVEKLSMGEALYCIRSNMVNGWPPR